MNRYLLYAGRFLMALVFVLSGIGKISDFGGTERLLASEGVPLAAIATVVVILVEVGTGLMLMFGFWPGWAALVLFLYLIPVTLVVHNYWAAPPAQHQNQFAHFLKNISIMGGLLAYFAREPR